MDEYKKEKIDYNSFFKKYKHYKQTQENQKKRGLNDYNILTSVLKQNDEVRLHSRMIKSLLDPNGTHYQDNLFLDIFLEVLEILDFNIKTKSCWVETEYGNKKDRIDIYVTDNKKHIIIENKLDATDQKEQIKRYIDLIYDENSDVKYNDILVIYLSIDKDKPSDESLGKYKIKKSSIKNCLAFFYVIK